MCDPVLARGAGEVVELWWPDESGYGEPVGCVQAMVYRVLDRGVVEGLDTLQAWTRS